MIVGAGSRATVSFAIPITAMAIFVAMAVICGLCAATSPKTGELRHEPQLA